VGLKPHANPKDQGIDSFSILVRARLWTCSGRWWLWQREDPGGVFAIPGSSMCRRPVSRILF